MKQTDRRATKIEDRDRVLLRVGGNPVKGLFDVGEKLVAETALALVEPVASLLEVERGEPRYANRAVQRGAGFGSGRRAFKSARTSVAGRAVFASSSNVSRRRRSSASTSGLTGVFSAFGLVGSSAGRFTESGYAFGSGPARDGPDDQCAVSARGDGATSVRIGSSDVVTPAAWP